MAHEIASAERVCSLWAMGVTQHCGGSDTSTAISNLMLVTGNYMRPGTGCYPLRGHNNVQGASDFGAMPIYFPGYEKVDDEEVRERYERGWNCKLPDVQGPGQPRDGAVRTRWQAEGHVRGSAKTCSARIQMRMKWARLFPSSSFSSCRIFSSARPAASPT